MIKKLSLKYLIILILFWSFQLFHITITIGQSNGYIYLHLKQLDEQQNQNFSFTISEDVPNPTDPSFPITVNLNDYYANNNISPINTTAKSASSISSSLDGTLWTISNKILYYRLINTSEWISTNINNVKAFTGLENNAVAYITEDNNLYIYNASQQNPITQLIQSNNLPSNLGNNTQFKEITYTKNGTLLLLAHPVGGTTGNVYKYSLSSQNSTWTLAHSSSYIRKISGSLHNENVFYYNTSYNQDITAYDFSVNSALHIIAPPVASANLLDFTEGKENELFMIYTPTNSYRRVFKYNIASNAYSTTFGENQSRNARHITASAFGQVWITGSPSITSPFSNIYVRTTSTNNTDVIYLDDERVRVSPTGNSIIIPVPAGKYKITQNNLPNNWNNNNITIIESTNNSTVDISNHTAYIDVSNDEIVYTTFENQFVTPYPVSNTCGLEFTVDFGRGSSTIGQPLTGLTSYHFYNDISNSVIPADGYYNIVKNSTLWQQNSTLKDQTNDPDGYFLVVNASYAADEFYRQRITNLRIGDLYTLEFWAANLAPGYALKPNITLGIYNINNNSIIGSVNTGEINTTSGEWKLYSFQFIATSTEVDLFIKNNNIGGNGNDLAIDQITFSSGTPPTPKILLDQTNCKNKLTITEPLDFSEGVYSVDYEYSFDDITYTDYTTFDNLVPGNYTIYVRKKGSLCKTSTTFTINRIICGKIYNDANGNVNNIIDGNPISLPNLYAVAYNSTTNEIVDIDTLNNDSFKLSITPTENHSIYITNSLNLDRPMTHIAVLDSPWVHTGYAINNVNNPTSYTGIIPINANFKNDTLHLGIQRKSIAKNQQYIINEPPNLNALFTLNGQTNNPPTLVGSDPEDMPTEALLTGKHVRIISIPNNGELIYNNIIITTPNYDIPNFDPTKLQFKMTSETASNMSFSYAYIDAANMEGYSGTYTFDWTYALPLNLISFNAIDSNCHIILNWKTSNEVNFSHFNVMHSINGKDYINIQTIYPKGFNLYRIVDSSKHTNNYYKLEMVDMNGNKKYSNTLKITPTKCSDQDILVYPNPVKNQLYIKNSSNTTGIIKIYNSLGQIIINENLNEYNIINTSNIPIGNYIMQLNLNNDTIKVFKFTKD